MFVSHADDVQRTTKTIAHATHKNMAPNADIQKSTTMVVMAIAEPIECIPQVEHRSHCKPCFIL